jgi:cysteinyl-tRNA synthetase
MSRIEAALNQHLDQMDKDEEARNEYENFMEQYHSEIEMYGTTADQLEKAKPEFMSDAFEAMSWLSDAQELLSRVGSDQQEREYSIRKANQLINRSKYFMGKIAKAEREAMEVESNDTLMSELILEKEDFEVERDFYNW